MPLSWDTVNNIYCHNALSVIYDGYTENSSKAYKKKKRVKRILLKLWINSQCKNPIH